MKSITLKWILYFFVSLILGCNDLFFEPEPPADSPVVNFMSLWTTFDEMYGPFEQRNVDWDIAFEIYRPLIRESTPESLLYFSLTDLLSELDDAHVTLTAPNRPVWNSNHIIRESIGLERFDLELIMRLYLSSFDTVKAFVAGIIRRNFDNEVVEIGYIYIRNFQGKASGDLRMPLHLLSTSIKGLIIDLRHNSGGDFRNGLAAASRFANERKLAFSTIAKIGPGPDDFTNPVDWYVEPAGKLLFEGPIIVLTDRYTLSAAERAVLAFKTLPNVTTVGDTTSGALGEKIGKQLPNGWYYSLTPQIVFAADGVSYEGRGIPPDVYITDEILLDNVLTAAVTLILMNAANK